MPQLKVVQFEIQHYIFVSSRVHHMQIVIGFLDPKEFSSMPRLKLV